jgi:crotonobetainyl-CoA:carnitine CoA-transferase CaiB-like acyl-CoA transferase
MPVAPAAHPAAAPPHWYRGKAGGPGKQLGRRRTGERPLVVDLSSLWAGPLCTHLLALAGARVVKVESTRRLDGARSGPSAFYDLLNAGKESVAIDFTSAEGRRILGALIERADVVVESSRPRALAQLGIDAADRVRSRRGLVWTSITGYGRDEPQSGWVAFGDDAAVAAGAAMAMSATEGTPLVCGDAIADPLTGMHAALAALHHWMHGESVLLDVSLHDVTAHCLSSGIAGSRAEVRRSRRRQSSGGADAHDDGWEVALDG